MSGLAPAGKPQPELLLLAGATALLLLFPTAVFVIEVLAHRLGLQGIVWAVESVLGPICHHIPARTLTVGERLLPVCARCSGMYGAAAVGGFLGAMVGLKRGVLRVVVALALLMTAVGLLAPMVELFGWIQTGNATRVVLGAMLGVGPTVLMGLGLRVLVHAGLGGGPLGQRQSTQ